MKSEITYIILLQPSQKILNEAKKLRELESEIPHILNYCFKNARIENFNKFRDSLNLPLNEDYRIIYSVTVNKKITQEQRCFFEQSFSNYKSKKILRLDELVKKE